MHQITVISSDIQENSLTIRYHKGDLPNLDLYRKPKGNSIAIDTEALGLNNHRDRLCVVQLSPGDGSADVIQIAKGQKTATNLVKLLKQHSIIKIFHFARFDVAILLRYLKVETGPVYCTKIASKLTRTYTDRHGLKDLVREYLGVEVSKQQQSSDWAADELSKAQLEYAASDVLHLHGLKKVLDEKLAREGRSELANACFEFVLWRAKLDLAGWPDTDIFSHS